MTSDSETSNTHSIRGLLPVSPDLVVTRHPGESPVITEAAPWVAARLGREARDLVGLSVSSVEPALPGLTSLVDAALGGDGPVVSGRISGADAAAAPSLVATPTEQASGDGGSAVSVQVLATDGDAGLRAAHASYGLIGHGPAMRALFARIERYAASTAPVLLTGESGTGKELVARALHERGPRRRGPFVPVNCAALSPELIESELFGHEKGAFTGAVTAHRGRFERAHGGTLFLDEIGDMPRKSQTKLLRVLEDGAVERVGAERPYPVDVRVVAATNVPLERSVAERRFREDLYFRLSVLRLHLPPVRERPEDIPLLVTYFLSVFANQYGRPLLRLTPGALLIFTSYPWPGNVREIKNVLERVVVETAGDVIGERALSEWIRERERLTPGAWDVDAGRRARLAAPPLVTPYHPPRLPSPTAPTIEARFTDVSATGPALTRDAALEALKASRGNVTRAAQRLGVHKTTLYRRLRAWGVTRKDFSSPA
ncbi:MAG: sigma-54 interaction domain-containing protein [Nitrospirota bacterium]